jgi:hypothetical protein
MFKASLDCVWLFRWFELRYHQNLVKRHVYVTFECVLRACNSIVYCLCTMRTYSLCNATRIELMVHGICVWVAVCSVVHVDRRRRWWWWWWHVANRIEHCPHFSVFVFGLLMSTIIFSDSSICVFIRIELSWHDSCKLFVKQSLQLLQVSRVTAITEASHFVWFS